MNFFEGRSLTYKILVIRFVTSLIVISFSFSTTYSQDKKLRFSHLTIDDGLSQNTIFGIVKDKYGFMWFGTWAGLNRFDGYKFRIYTADVGNPKALPSNRIISVLSDSLENIWVMTRDSSVAKYNYETDDFTRFNKKQLSHSFLDQFFLTYRKVSSANYEWKWKMNTIEQTNLKTKNVITYINNPFDKWSVHISNTIWLYMDNHQILWVGGYYHGICYADFLQKSFSSISTDQQDSKKNIILDNKVRAICQDNNDNLWIGTTESGISCYNKLANASIHFQYDPNDPSHDNRNFYLNHIRAIFCDKDGIIWIGAGAGIRSYNPHTKKTKYYWLEPENNEANTPVRTILQDYKGDIWICARNSIRKYDRKKDMFIKYKPLNSIGFENPKYRILIEDKKKNFWVTTELTGLVCLKRSMTKTGEEKLEPILYKYSSSNKNTIGDNFIYHVFEDEDGLIWAGTTSGISFLNPLTEKFTRIDKSKGLPDESILGILSDRKGNIWVSHTKGLSKIEKKTLAVRNYSNEDGLISNDFMENACYRDEKTGTMYFGSLNGLVYFHPDSIKNNPNLPKVVFTNLKINNNPVKMNQSIDGRVILSQPIWLTKEVQLNGGDKSFSVEFSALHFSNPRKNKYKYMLEGFDKNWISTDASSREAKYSNLEPKTYILKVIASNNDGLWNEEGASLKIIITPPIWETLWFRMLLISIIIGLLYLAYNIRIALYRKRQAELDLLVKTRTMELEQSNEHLIESQTRIEEYAEEVTIKSEKLKSINQQLLERQTQVEEQSEELKVHTENLKEANDLLLQKQKVIEAQTEIMQVTNEELVKLNATKDKLFSIIAHDLRNPFHSVIGFSELLLSKLEKLPMDKTKKYIQLIYNVSTSGNDLLDNLLQWSRSQTGRISFEPQNTSVAGIANGVLTLLEGNAHAKNIKIRQLMDPDIYVYADENMLKTILRNLLSNAIKFSYVNSEIIMSLKVTDNCAEIHIKDSGVGIPEENLGFLFNIDHNFTTKGTSNEGGTGLGLLICKEFIEFHKGKIWVESKVGEGSIFKFTLPIAASE